MALVESHAAAAKHAVITVEKTIGITKKYIQLKRVTAAKESARTHAVPRMSGKVSAGRFPSCYASIAASS